jgi:hypothetical protein
MRNSRTIIKRVAIALSALLLVSAVGLAQVTVSLPTVTSKVGTTQAIPITVGDLTGKGVIAFQTVVTYDKTIIKMTGVTTTGTLSSALTAPTVNNDTANGKITIAAAGTSSMSGAGTLIYLNASMVAKGTTALTFTSFQFNEGTPAVTLTNGQAIVPVLSVKAADITTSAPIGGTFNLPITTEDLTGKGVLSYQFTLKFDATKIKLTGVTIAGTMSSGFSAPVVNTTTAGQITVAAAGTTALTGATTLIIVTGQVVNAGTSAVQFTSFQFNEGTPSGSGVDGSVLVGTPVKPVLVSRTPTTLTTASQGFNVAFVVHASDLGGAALQYTWKQNGAVVKGPGTDSTYTAKYTTPHGTAYNVTCVFTTTASLSDSTVWTFTVTDVSKPYEIPTDFSLAQNYPNPFNPTTMMTFSLPKEAPVSFEIYNMLGVRIRTLMAGDTKSAGVHSVTWDGKDDSGLNMPSGVYLYRIHAGTFLASKKMTLLK